MFSVCESSHNHLIKYELYWNSNPADLSPFSEHSNFVAEFGAINLSQQGALKS